MVDFSERLKLLREEKGFFQRELAIKLNLSRVTITHYEQGKRTPEWGVLQKLADIFDVSVDYLLGRTDQRQHGMANPHAHYETEAAHRQDDPMADLPPEARRSLEEFKEYILKKYGKGGE